MYKTSVSATRAEWVAWVVASGLSIISCVSWSRNRFPPSPSFFIFVKHYYSSAIGRAGEEEMCLHNSLFFFLSSATLARAETNVEETGTVASGRFNSFIVALSLDTMPFEATCEICSKLCALRYYPVPPDLHGFCE